MYFDGSTEFAIVNLHLSTSADITLVYKFVAPQEEPETPETPDTPDTPSTPENPDTKSAQYFYGTVVSALGFAAIANLF